MCSSRIGVFGRECRPRRTVDSMLAEMRIQGLGVIDDATLELDPGLTVLTGETGAGKTMVVTGLTCSAAAGRGVAGATGRRARWSRASRAGSRPDRAAGARPRRVAERSARRPTRTAR